MSATGKLVAGGGGEVGARAHRNLTTYYAMNGGGVRASENGLYKANLVGAGPSPGCRRRTLASIEETIRTGAGPEYPQLCRIGRLGMPPGDQT